MISVLAILKTIWGFLSKIPWWVYVIIVVVVYHFAAVHEAEVSAKAECNAAWQKKEAQAKSAYDAEVAKLQAQNAAKEDAWRTKITEIGVDNANDIQAIEDQAATDVAAARSGALRLRYTRGSVPAGDRSGGKAPPAPQNSDAAASSELPPEIAANLLQLADDADEVAKQLQSCQAVINAERQ